MRLLRDGGVERAKEILGIDVIRGFGRMAILKTEAQVRIERTRRGNEELGVQRRGELNAIFGRRVLEHGRQRRTNRKQPTWHEALGNAHVLGHVLPEASAHRQDILGGVALVCEDERIRIRVRNRIVEDDRLDARGKSGASSLADNDTHGHTPLLIPLYFVVQLDLRFVVSKRDDLSRIGFEDFIERLDSKAGIGAEPGKPPRDLRIDGYIRGLVVVILVLNQIRRSLSYLSKSLKTFGAALSGVENLFSLRERFEINAPAENIEARIAVGLGLCIQG